MNKDFDKEFEEYLNGDSDISRLYSQAKTGRVSEQLADAVKKSVQSDARTADIIPVNRKPKKRAYIPFAIAATLLLSFVVFTNITNEESSGDKQVLALNSAANDQPVQPNQEVTTELEVNPVAGEHNDSENITEETIIAKASTDNKVTEDDIKDAATQVAQNQSENTQLQLSQPVQTNQDVENSGSPRKNIETVNEMVAKQEMSPVLNDQTNGDLKDQSAEKNIQIADTGIADESTADEETTYSLDWMNQLTSRAPNRKQLTSQTSNSMSEKEWVEKILRLHNEDKHEEAAKNIKEFRKLFPRYKLPRILQDAYE